MAYGASAAIQKGIGMMVFLWLAKALPVQEYAEFGLLYALQSALATLAIAGLIEAVIGLHRYDDSSAASGAKLFAAANVLSSVMSVVTAAAVAALFLLTADANNWSPLTLLWVVLSGILLAISTLQSALVRLREQHWASLLLGSVAPLAGLLVGAVSFGWLGSLSAYFFGTACGLAVVLLVCGTREVGTWSFRSDAYECRYLLMRVAPFTLVAVLGWIAGYGNTWLVKFFYADREVARFAFAYTVSSILQLVATALNQAWNPRFFRLLQTEPAATVERRCQQFSLLQGLALGVVGAVILLALPPVLSRLGGNLLSYRAMTMELLLLFAAYAVSVPWWHAQNYFYAHGKGADLMNLSILSTLAGCGLLLLSVWCFGVIGFYIGFLMQMLARTISAAIWARRRWQIKVAWQGALAASVLLLGGAGAAVAMSR